MDKRHRFGNDFWFIVWLSGTFPFAHLNAQDLMKPSHVELYQCVDVSVDREKKGSPFSGESLEGVFIDHPLPRSTLVDVRITSGHAQLVKLANSISLNPDLIKSKSYLMAERLVLVGEGLDDGKLASLAKELNDRGFSRVKVLRFGINGLIESDKLEGGVNDQFNLRYLTVEKLISVRASLSAQQKFLFIDLSKDQSDLDASEIVHFPYINNSHWSREFSELLVAYRSRFPHAYIVLMHEDASVYRHTQSLMGAGEFPGVWFLDGGKSKLIDLEPNARPQIIYGRGSAYSCGR